MPANEIISLMCAVAPQIAANAAKNGLKSAVIAGRNKQLQKEAASQGCWEAGEARCSCGEATIASTEGQFHHDAAG